MTTRPYEFPESLVESTGAGPDFPGSSGDREKGKFRPSATPRLTQVAVTGDDGKPVVQTAEQVMAELLLWQKATVLALMYNAAGEEFSLADVLDEAGRL